MRKQLTEIEEIDAFLLQTLRGVPLLVFRARLAVSAELRAKVRQQQQVHQVIKYLGREEQRQQLQAIHDHLMEDASFHHSITSIFQ
ncbi:hypothetical protein CLV59_11242 [Chitinophaga dinghuensis]|uniref:Uncharacterized protein n=1 Tax=Chitinophaga dinghuensis TaxID=1539050 RepID=A0A327VLH1_9BACT|nr:hypothetical protein [Chitinophaga dinghuensis]RAJ73701.1 hypothetical protein CLV59_11242 [Chitinophaga dinghuensis]